MSSVSSWGDLPQELLTIIFQHLTNNYNLPDLYQCLAVCHSWRFVAKELWQTSSVATAPSLLLQSEEPYKLVLDTSLFKSHTKTKGAITTRTTTSLISWQIPIDDNKVTIYGSFGGWLLLCDGLVVYVYNPMSRVLIQLPQLPTRFKLHPYIGFLMSETYPTDPNCIICIWEWTRLAICKPAPRWYNKYNSKGFVCSSPSSSWVLSEQPSSSSINIRHMIFYRKKIYTVDDDGSLFVHSKVDDVLKDDGDGMSLPWPVEENKVAEGYHIYNNNILKSASFELFLRLVESKNGELLLVHRTFKNKYYFNTVFFNVFKLNWGKEKYYWEKISRLNEKEALFLGPNDYISVSVSDDDNIYKSNCIYFYNRTLTYQVWNYGVYDIGTNTFHHSQNFHEPETGPYFCGLFAPSTLSYI